MIGSDYDRICMMIHPGRVGSTVLAGGLCSLPLLSAGEIHNPIVNGIENWPNEYNYLELFEHMLLHSKEKGSPYTNKVEFEDARFYFFEYKPFHLGCGTPLSEAVEKFSQKGVTDFIFLHRKNYLKRYVSYLLAKSTGVWHVSSVNSAQTKVNVDLQRCWDTEIGLPGPVPFLELVHHYYRSFAPSVQQAVCNKRHLTINYEDHIEHEPSLAFNMVKDFLGINGEYTMLETGLQKQNTQSLNVLIENYDEVAELLVLHGYHSLLD